jgi:hypothetical protein
MQVVFMQVVFMQVVRRTLTLLLLLGPLLLPMTQAVVPLGDPLPAVAGINWPTGRFLLTLYTHTCAEPGVFEQHWQALAASKLPILAVNVPENHWPTLLPPTKLMSDPLFAGFIGGEPAFTLSRTLKIRRYPTTIAVDSSGRMREVIEQPLDSQHLLAVLGRLALK